MTRGPLPSATFGPIALHDVDRSYYVGDATDPRGLFRLYAKRGPRLESAWAVDPLIALFYRRGDRVHVALFPWRLGLRALSSLRPADLARFDTLPLSARLEAWLCAVFWLIAKLGGVDPARLFTAAELGFRDEDGALVAGDDLGDGADGAGGQP